MTQRALFVRPDQSPRDLYDHPNRGWIWLGCPGWFGAMPPEKQSAVRGFLDAHANEIPERPGEWTVLP